MSQTQLASMFIGANRFTSSTGGADRLTGIKSSIGNIIHFTDGKNDNILSIATAKDITGNPIHHKSLKDNVETFDFELIGERNHDEHIVKGNRVIMPGEHAQQLVEFTIDEVIDERERGKGFEVFTYASYLDLSKGDAIEPFSFTGTAQQHLGRALQNTEHEVGVVESDRTITISFENWTNPYEYIKRIAREFDLEVDFEIMHNGLKVTNRVVNLVDQVGAWRGREVTFGKDLQSIRRKESGDIYTALIGLGPEREDGTRLQVLVEDFEALERWGRPEHDPQHLIGVYEPQSEREDMTLSQLRQYTQTELNKRSNSVVSYEINFLDLEHILGHENKKIRFGDTIRIKDTMYDPPLYIQARIFEMKRNPITEAEKEYVLGDFVEFTEDDVKSIYRILKRDLAKKAGIDLLLNYAEPKKVESDTAPDIKEGENPIWVDTSRTPHVSHVVNNGEWVKMTPTTPAEVDAYTKSQVDNKAQEEAEAKAAQALADAQAFSRNADNIDQGVIDVGAIPLRTSITGARLEWDGVNGLVQYNALGEPVSWLDLDANAHFANAFLSGRVEALEGYFGENQTIRIRNGRVEMVRPDGAISMNDGMIHQDYAVSGFDPQLMDNVTWSGQRFHAFGPIAGYYEREAGIIDGRGLDSLPSVDIRDPNKRYTVSFQRYEIIHSARYFVLGYRVASNSRVGRHRANLFEGSTHIMEIILPGGSTSDTYHLLMADLGTPTFERRSIDLRIGWNLSWLDRSDLVRFRINRVYQTDFI